MNPASQEISQDDIEKIKQDPNSRFALGLAANQNLTEAQIQQLIDVVESIFKQDTYCLLTTSLFPLDLSENPNLTQTHMQQLIDDILLEKVNEKHRYYKFNVALGLAKNPNLAQTQSQELIDAQVPKLIDQMKHSPKLPDYQYVFDLAKNPNLTETHMQQLIDVVKQKLNLWCIMGLARNPNLTQTQCKELIDLVSFEKIGHSGSEATRFLNKAARFIADRDSKKVS